MSMDNSRANQGNASPNARYSPTDHAKNRRDELARTLGRTDLYALDYQDPDVLQGAVDAGYTISEIAAAFSIDTETVRRWMDNRGVESPRALDHGGAVREGLEKGRDQQQALEEADQ